MCRQGIASARREVGTGSRLRESLTKFIDLKMFGVMVKIPANYEEVLSAHYGEWKVKNAKWYYTTSSGKKGERLDLPGIAHICDLNYVLNS